MIVLRAMLSLIWSLWFGGVIALLLFVTQLFKSSHETGAVAAPVLFHTFSIYQVALGGIVILITAILAGRTPAARHVFLFLMLIFAISMALAVPIAGWTKQLEFLRQTGESQSPTFKSLHSRVGLFYGGLVATLLFARYLMSFLSPARYSTPRNRSNGPVASA